MKLFLLEYSVQTIAWEWTHYRYVIDAHDAYSALGKLAEKRGVLVSVACADTTITPLVFDNGIADLGTVEEYN